jgi:hypothetical protein
MFSIFHFYTILYRNLDLSVKCNQCNKSTPIVGLSGGCVLTPCNHFHCKSCLCKKFEEILNSNVKNKKAETFLCPSCNVKVILNLNASAKILKQFNDRLVNCTFVTNVDDVLKNLPFYLKKDLDYAVEDAVVAATLSTVCTSSCTEKVSSIAQNDEVSNIRRTSLSTPTPVSSPAPSTLDVPRATEELNLDETPERTVESIVKEMEEKKTPIIQPKDKEEKKSTEGITFFWLILMNFMVAYGMEKFTYLKVIKKTFDSVSIFTNLSLGYWFYYNILIATRLGRWFQTTFLYNLGAFTWFLLEIGVYLFGFFSTFSSYIDLSILKSLPKNAPQLLDPRYEFELQYFTIFMVGFFIMRIIDFIQFFNPKLKLRFNSKFYQLICQVKLYVSYILYPAMILYFLYLYVPITQNLKVDEWNSDVKAALVFIKFLTSFVGKNVTTEDSNGFVDLVFKLYQKDIAQYIQDGLNGA